MSRPRRSEHTREALIEAGIAQLSQHGYHGTGIKQILDEVKVPKGSFYNYFASKEAFVAELIREYAANVLRELDSFQQASQHTMSPLDQIRAVYTYMLTKYESLECRQSCLIGTIAAEIGGSSELCQQAMQDAVKTWSQRIGALIVAAQQRGQLRSDIPADKVSGLIWSVWEGSLIRMKLDGNSQSARDTINLLLDVLLAEPAQHV